jgi:hypothetical protein
MEIKVNGYTANSTEYGRTERERGYCRQRTSVVVTPWISHSRDGLALAPTPTATLLLTAGGQRNHVVERETEEREAGSGRRATPALNLFLAATPVHLS